MMIDQAEIDALLAQAEEVSGPAPVAVATAAPEARPAPARLDVTPEIARLLKLRVPVIVQLARRRMSIERIRRLSTGVLIEFAKVVNDDLDLLINNRRIGAGTAVKVGEKFGLRVTRIGSKAERIKSMG